MNDLQSFPLRRLMAALLALAMLCALSLTGLALAPPTPPPDCVDVPPSAWYYWDVQNARILGLMQGVGSGRFEPDVPMTRGMFVTVLYRLSGDVRIHDHFTEYERPFGDVQDDAWYAEAALWSGLHEVVRGTEAGTFSPDAILDREQAATLLLRFLQYMEAKLPEETTSVPFTDRQEISVWAFSGVRCMYTMQIMVGDEAGRFLPKEPLTRAECAKLAVLAFRATKDCFRPTRIRGEELSRGFRPDAELPKSMPDDARTTILDFCANLFRASDQPGQNTVISPASALYALAMCANGAEGESLRQMEAAFGLPMAQLNPALACWKRDLTQAGRTCALHNGIWISRENGFIVPDRFLQTNADYYGADVYRIPFDDEGADAVNAWIRNGSRGLIKRLLDCFPNPRGLCLTNTLYLRALWGTPYGSTEAGVFTTAAGEQVTCQMLEGCEQIYLEDETFTGFLKPLQDGFACVALLPKQDLETALKGLTGAELRSLLDTQSTAYQVNTAMPELSLEWSSNLIPALQKLGVLDPFEPGKANFAGMGDDSLVVREILQKTRLALDCSGVTAAAATLVTLTPESALEPTPTFKTVRLDRPYLLLILDTETELPLFLAAVEQP